MTPNRELELKLELAPASLPKLKKIRFMRERAAPPRHTREVSVYFDTDKQKLRRKGLTLRVRRIGRRYFQTIKASDAGLFDRQEWEAEIAGETPDLDLLRGTTLAPIFNDKLRRKLKPLFATRVRRSLYRLAGDDHAIALTIDRGKIVSGARSAPLCEVELELEHGDVTRVFEAARELARAVPARLAVKSKSERGYELVDGVPGAPLKAASLRLKAGMSPREAVRTIGHACLRQIVGNEPALLGGDSEGVQQMRVGLRRLRAAMSRFGDILVDPQSAAIEAETKWLAGALAGKRARSAVRSARFRALTLEIAAWLEIGEWRKIRKRGK